MYFYVAVLALTSVLGGVWYLAPFLLRKRQERELRSLCRRNRLVALTYDDGPGIELTDRLLDLLDELNVKAGFFVLGKNIDAAPATMQRIRKAGHEVGNHCHDHVNAWKSLPHEALIDIERGRRKLAQFGINGKSFRPPYGKMTLLTFIYMKIKGMQPYWWTIDCRDSLETRKEAESVIDEIRSAGGGVVLLHDFDGYKLEGHSEYVLDLTRRIVDYARSAGIEVVPPSKVTALGNSPG